MVRFEIPNGESQRVLKRHLPQPALFHKFRVSIQNVEVRHAVRRIVSPALSPSSPRRKGRCVRPVAGASISRGE